ncbi:winged helix-turn-helix transcriptional regulator [Agrilactobacillus fermenti]|uniref:winged helix-turn-helix transcriptional regulator n=1 Tax=Agrilactobacillus fermenti TaxID=2586909 RepID=UPI0038B29E2E
MMQKTTNVEACQKKQIELCPRFQKTFSILGKKWNGLIIDVLVENGTLRFRDLAHSIEKCSDRVLVERLKELERENIVSRVSFYDSNLVEYHLTEKGKALAPVMASVHAWADEYITEAECDA